MDITVNRAFEVVNSKVEPVLAQKEYTPMSAASSSGDELAQLYTGSDDAYSIVYLKSKKHMVMRVCGMSGGEPDNEWKTIATWIYDPATDGEREAQSIGNDFAESLAGPKIVAASVQQKRKNKKKGDDEGGDPVFFSKRLINVFPELKDEIRYEENHYETFRAVTFTKEHVLPRVRELMDSGDKDGIAKLGKVLSAQYDYGDLDTRSVITIVILNSITDPQQQELIREELSDDLNTAWKAAAKYRNKKVKPEKQKKKKQSFMQKMMEQSAQQTGGR